MDRFDILEAYYVFGMLWHGGQGCEHYRNMCRALNAGYKPGSAASNGILSSEGARAVYRGLCIKAGV
jgi:UPF0716 family protein affecting phage T7 exclusion